MLTPSQPGAEKSPSDKSPNPKRGSVWKIVLWGVAVLFVIAILLAVFFWTQRYSLIENYAKNLLREQGIEAELSITSLSREAVILRDVSLTYQSEPNQSEASPFFKAKRIEADYILKEAMNGRMKRLRLVEPFAKITLDEQFRIIDGWLPPRDQESDGAPITIPEYGLQIEDGEFDMVTPYGEPIISINADIKETDQFVATLLLKPSSYQYHDWTTEGSARLDMKVDGNNKDIDGLIKIDSLAGEGLVVSEATLSIVGPLTVNTQLPIDIDTLDMDFNGRITGAAELIENRVFSLDTSEFDWSGAIMRRTQSRVSPHVEGQLGLATEKFSILNKGRAKELAQLLTLSEPLLKTPIAQHFSPSLTATLENLLEQSAIDTRADINFDGETASIALVAPFRTQRNNQTLEVWPSADVPLYVWNHSDKAMKLAFNANLNSPVPLALTNARMGAVSSNAWQLQGVTQFSGQMATKASWRVKADGEATRLAPFKANLNYVSNEKTRRLMVQGGIDFDGRLPMGYVEKLVTRGRVDLNLAPLGQNGLSLNYTPSDPIMTLSKLTNDTDWILKDVSFKLAPKASKAGPHFATQGLDKAKIAAGLETVSFSAFHKTEDNNFAIQADNVVADGALNFTKAVQDWTLDFQSAHMTSDTLPMSGTKAYIPTGSAAINYTTDALNFDFETPSLNVSLLQGSAEGLAVKAKGTPDDFWIEHSGGVIETDMADIPQWPVTGRAHYTTSGISGHAEAVVPRANNAIVKSDYHYFEGAGRAQVNLESLVFKPRGFQPQDLIPALRGKITSVEGVVAATVNLTFADGALEQSDGILDLTNMNFSTPPGPVKGLNTQIKLSSLLPFQSQGVQTLTLEEFNPGIALKGGAAEYELLPEGVRITSARWPLGEGAFALDPFTWSYGALQNRVVMRLDDIPINELLKTFGNEKIEATGIARGEFPVVVEGIKVTVDKGFIEAKDGGTIRYNPDEGTAVTYSQEQALDIIRRQDTAEYRNLARDAMREFKYRELRASVDGPLDGDVELAVVFDGTNKKVLNGQPFEFDIEVQGELFNILRSFNSNAHLQSQLRKQAQDLAAE